MKTDVLVIGGGVIGLSIARELHKRGERRITIVEKGRCGEEASWAAAGMLGPQAEADEAGAFFDLCSRSRDLYPALAGEMLDETGIDIELDRAGTLTLAFNDNDVRRLRQRKIWQDAAGLEVERLGAEERRKAEPFVSPDIREALYFPNDWQVENRRLLAALRRYADLNGIGIVENTRVDKLVVENSRVTGISTLDGAFTGGTIVLATGAWTSLIKLGLADMTVRVEPVRGQIIAFKTAKRLFERVIYGPDGYIVPSSADGRILAGSTSENVGFDRSVTLDAATALQAMASGLSPGLAGLAMADQWSGLRPFAGDSLPIIGSIAGIDDLAIATAHYRNGILLAPLTARIVADRIVNGVDDAALTTFGPDRFRFAATGS